MFTLLQTSKSRPFYPYLQGRPSSTRTSAETYVIFGFSHHLVSSFRGFVNNQLDLILLTLFIYLLNLYSQIRQTHLYADCGLLRWRRV